MRCTQCAAVSFSAAARTLVEQDYRCPQCGGELMLVPVEPPVAVGAEDAPRDERDERRFERE